MSTFSVRLKIALAVVAVSGVVVSAEQAAVSVPAKRATRKPVAATARHGNQIESVISGTALDSKSNPLPNAALRLRNLQIRKIEQSATSDHLGEFRFVVKPQVPYVVELVDRAGRVLAVGDVITPEVGEVAGTIVALPGKLPALAGLFGDTAGAVISATVGAGITALQPVPPVSPEK